MKIFSSPAVPVFLLATSALRHAVNSFPIESSTSVIPSDDSSTNLEGHILSTNYGGGYLLNNSVETLDNFSKELNYSLAVSQKIYEEDPFSNTLDDYSFEPLDNLPEWKEYDAKYPHLTTFEETTITSEASSIATSEETPTTIPETTSTITAPSQEQTTSQGWWPYLSYPIAFVGLAILGAAATMFTKNKSCSNGVQRESNEEIDTFDLSNFLKPVSNDTLKFDN
ncbi:MAG: hypothetical protein LBH67_00650 [Rickettsia sp.]|jgi:hypothetical protein|nr:hypothetical protein [Rickettsia sp.]